MLKLLKHLTNAPVAIALAFLLVGHNVAQAHYSSNPHDPRYVLYAKADCEGIVIGEVFSYGAMKGRYDARSTMHNGRCELTVEAVRDELCETAGWFGAVSTITGVASTFLFFTGVGAGFGAVLLGVSWVTGAIAIGGGLASCSN